MIDLDKKYADYIKNIIAQNLDNYKLYIFGSRVKGSKKKYSDIDIAIASNELTSQIKSKLEFIFENSTIPYKIDIIDLNNITEKFKSLIEQDLVEL